MRTAAFCCCCSFKWGESELKVHLHVASVPFYHLHAISSLPLLVEVIDLHDQDPLKTKENLKLNKVWKYQAQWPGLLC